MIWDSSGAAPDAKIAFFDIGDSNGDLSVRGERETSVPSLASAPPPLSPPFVIVTSSCTPRHPTTKVPSNMDGYMFPAAYDIGARISTHSWGSECVSSYRDADLQVDEYMYVLNASASRFIPQRPLHLPPTSLLLHTHATPPHRPPFGRHTTPSVAGVGR